MLLNRAAAANCLEYCHKDVIIVYYTITTQYVPLNLNALDLIFLPSKEITNILIFSIVERQTVMEKKHLCAVHLI